MRRELGESQGQTLCRGACAKPGGYTTNKRIERLAYGQVLSAENSWTCGSEARVLSRPIQGSSSYQPGEWRTILKRAFRREIRNDSSLGSNSMRYYRRRCIIWPGSYLANYYCPPQVQCEDSDRLRGRQDGSPLKNSIRLRTSETDIPKPIYVKASFEVNSKKDTIRCPCSHVSVPRPVASGPIYEQCQEQYQATPATTPPRDSTTLCGIICDVKHCPFGTRNDFFRLPFFLFQHRLLVAIGSGGSSRTAANATGTEEGAIRAARFDVWRRTILRYNNSESLTGVRARSREVDRMARASLKQGTTTRVLESSKYGRKGNGREKNQSRFMNGRECFTAALPSFQGKEWLD